jgi:NAD(P)-dependent dehydrogenase (short-subunit alcohol dehydrogenase family)
MSSRVAILAGAAGELGRATAQKLAGAGLTVVGIDRNEEGLKELPDGVRYEVGDPTDPAVAKRLVERIAVEVGPPEVLINTVGTYHLGGALDGTSLLSTIFASAIGSYVTAHLAAVRIIGRQTLMRRALAHGYSTAFWWAADIFPGGAVIGGALLRPGPLEQPESARPSP